jgi:hypothetical protein
MMRPIKRRLGNKSTGKSLIAALAPLLGRYHEARKSLRGCISQQSRQGLDWMNFFLADVQTAFGAFVAFYLADLGWSKDQVGPALTVGTLTAVISQIPGGALVDAVRWKRGLTVIGIGMICASALILALMPSFALVFLGLTGLTADIRIGVDGHVNGRHHATGPRLLFPMQGCFSFITSRKMRFPLHCRRVRILALVPVRRAIRLKSSDRNERVKSEEKCCRRQQGRCDLRIRTPSMGRAVCLSSARTPRARYHNPAFQKEKTVVLYCASGGRSALAGKVTLALI